MASARFDRVAATFDEQRGFPAHISDQLRDLVLGQLMAAPETRLFELGVGTGRIAAPFVAAGCRYVGLDNSAAMLSRCRAKLGADDRLSLILGDMRRLPLPDHAFDAVIAASVFRAARPWQAVAAEMSRVLARPGAVVLIHHEAAPDSMEAVLARRKRAFLAYIGVGAYPAGGAGDDDVAALLVSQGATAETGETDCWSSMHTPRQTIERHLGGSRVAGQPFAPELRRDLETCARQQYGALDAQVPVERSLRIRIFRLSAT